MADTPTTEQTAAAAEPAAAVTTQTNFKVSLESFATKLSASDTRVALIHGWVHAEKAAKRFRDFPANYAARYKAFENQPV